MCATITKYETKTQKLQRVIYPQITNLLDELKCYIDIHNYENLENNIVLLQTEFNSLVHVENKLVFPAVLSIFNDNFDFKYFPNIPEIIHLTSTKEAKIKIYLSNIETIVAIDITQPKNDFEKDIAKLIHLFKNVYFPVKQRWNSLLQMLTPESVQCENRKNNSCKCGTHEHKHEEKALH